MSNRAHPVESADAPHVLLVGRFRNNGAGVQCRRVFALRVRRFSSLTYDGKLVCHEKLGVLLLKLGGHKMDARLGLPPSNVCFAGRRFVSLACEREWCAVCELHTARGNLACLIRVRLPSCLLRRLGPEISLSAQELIW
jgi:hypothetical protein